MTDLKDLLAYQQPLNDAAFNQQLLQKIKTADNKRRVIMSVCTLLGLLLSITCLWLLLPADSLPDLLTPSNGLLLFSIGLFVAWLWTEELSDS